MKELFKKILNILEDIKETTITNNQLIGFMIEKQYSNIPNSKKRRTLFISNEQIDYMMENDISFTEWGDS
tara:strand:- start:2103 stop:2312 length:210 start_codon:yes stop_codon:yes gene_type:complete